MAHYCHNKYTQQTHSSIHSLTFFWNEERALTAGIKTSVAHRSSQSLCFVGKSRAGRKTSPHSASFNSVLHVSRSVPFHTFSSSSSSSFLLLWSSYRRIYIISAFLRPSPFNVLLAPADHYPIPTGSTKNRETENPTSSGADASAEPHNKRTRHNTHTRENLDEYNKYASNAHSETPNSRLDHTLLITCKRLRLCPLKAVVTLCQSVRACIVWGGCAQEMCLCICKHALLFHCISVKGVTLYKHTHSETFSSFLPFTLWHDCHYWRKNTYT